MAHTRASWLLFTLLAFMLASAVALPVRTAAAAPENTARLGRGVAHLAHRDERLSGTATTPPEAHHSNGGLLGLREGTLVFTILVFVGLVLVLRYTAWDPMIKALQQRENTIRESIEAAARARAEAQKAAADLEARMAEVQRQGAQQLAQARADALRVAESIRVKAEQDATALKDRALRDIESAKQQALGELNTHVAQLGTAVARKILRREITPADQDRLLDGVLTQVPSGNN